jgi:hypothetical protein
MKEARSHRARVIPQRAACLSQIQERKSRRAPVISLSFPQIFRQVQFYRSLAVDVRTARGSLRDARVERETANPDLGFDGCRARRHGRAGIGFFRLD